MFKCPVCGYTDYKLKYNINSRLEKVPAGLTRPQKVNVKIIACRNCGLESNSKVINNFDFYNLYKQQSIYSKSETYKVNDEYPTYTKDIIDLLRSLYIEGYTVLEIGSFTGNLLFKLRKTGIKCEGVELDPNAAAIAKKRKLDVLYCGEVYDSHFDGKKYNIIIGIGILEHIQEPVKFLKRLKDLLEENGVIILQYPNRESLNALISRNTKHSWDMYAEPGHVFFYNKRNVKELLDRCDLRLKTFFTATILSRGKIPILPLRIVTLEEKIRHITQRNNILFFVYKKLLQLLDIFKMGDTNLIIVAKNDR